MLQLKNISKTYVSKRGQKTWALEAVSLEFAKTGMVFVVGKSGCGKSTLLNILGGLDRYDSGEIMIDGVSTEGFLPTDYDYYRNKYIGFVFQDYNLLEEESIESNISLALRLQKGGDDKVKCDKAKIDELLTRFGLAGYGGRLPDELSGGQKQRIAIIRALIKSPEIILADEPTGALDSESGGQILEILKEISREKLVIIVSHDKEYADKYADRVIELADGRVIADSAPLENSVEESEVGLAQKDKMANGGADTGVISDSGAGAAAENRAITDVPVAGVAGSEPAKAKSTEDKKRKSFAQKGSNLTFKDAFRMGASGLTHRKGRMIVSVFLASFAVFMFGVCTSFLGYNRNKVVLNTMYDQGITTTHLVRTTVLGPSGHMDYGPSELEPEDFTYFGKYYADDEIIYTDDNVQNLDKYLGDLKAENSSFDQILDKQRIRIGGSAKINVNSFKKFNYKLVGGAYPIAADEVAVSELYYKIFEYFGHRDPVTEAVTPINSYNDLIGKYICDNNYYDGEWHRVEGAFKIAGIINSDYNVQKYNSLFIPDEDDETKAEAEAKPKLYNVLKEEINYGAHGLLFVGSQYDEKELSYYRTLVLLKNNLRKDLKLMKEIESVILSESNGYYDVYRFDNSIKTIVVKAEKTLKTVSWIALGLGGMLAIFAAVMIFNYFAVSIMDKKKEIGILRALGARKMDIYRIFLSRGIIIALINAVIAVILTVGGIAVINFLLKTKFNFGITMLTFGIIPLVSILVLSVATMFVGSIIPIKRIANRPPAEAIKTL